jgi:predicted dithiol-disulfide oxidoreductase (DUF899 family)
MFLGNVESNVYSCSSMVTGNVGCPGSCTNPTAVRITDRTPKTRPINNGLVVSREEWIALRQELLKKEKELTRRRDRLNAERRELPWVRVEKNYVFDAPGGKVSLKELFAGMSQLVIYHFMFGSDWKEGCPSCSFVSDHIDGALPHLAARDVAMVMVSRAPLAKIEDFKKRMAGGSIGCRHTAATSTLASGFRSPRTRWRRVK